jgi:hypothetical protein
MKEPAVSINRYMGLFALGILVGCLLGWCISRLPAGLSLWQNGHVERLIGSIRRECLDHKIIYNAAHLRRVLWAHADLQQ